MAIFNSYVSIPKGNKDTQLRPKMKDQTHSFRGCLLLGGNNSFMGVKKHDDKH
jgi:hypothetical protein